jgi:hypothetical protein
MLISFRITSLVVTSLHNGFLLSDVKYRKVRRVEKENKSKGHGLQGTGDHHYQGTDRNQEGQKEGQNPQDSLRCHHGACFWLPGAQNKKIRFVMLILKKSQGLLRTLG